MSDFMDKQKQEFDDFVSKWEKAQEKGVFSDPQLPEINPQTSTGSFFGFTQTNNTDTANQTDQEYWNAINSAADDHDPKVINESKVIGTGNDNAYLKYVFTKDEIEKLTDEQKKDAARAIGLIRNEGEVAFQGTLPKSVKDKIVAYKNKVVAPDGTFKESLQHKSTPTNPISRDSVGCDQNLNPQSLGATYTEEELEKLDELKKELYSLENKMLTSIGFGDNKNIKKFENQIKSIKKEIHDLSDSLGRPFKNENQPKHLENI
jgi:hypothetical protein